MEDGMKEEPAHNKGPRFLGRYGWVKKAHGRLLTSYKDRYIHVEKTELVIYEDEDLLNCLERLDLESYDKCLELKSPFTKKHRLILVRSPKPGNKVHDVKFQVLTAEDKEAWIKAFTDGINRAKNKVFDEVKVDESSNLEHITRARPKGNRNRRPPTRIHMKEVAVVSSDGILRLDLDLEDAVMPNGTHYAKADCAEEATVSKPLPTVSEAVEVSSNLHADEEAQTESQTSPKKKVIKPPMPPTKEAKPTSVTEDEPVKQNDSEKKVLKPPMPPSKEAKPSTSSTEENTEDVKSEKIFEKSPDAKKKTCPPPTPPNKPTSQTNPHPPNPPSKENKPLHYVEDPGQVTADENEKELNMNETTGVAKETDQCLSEQVQIRDDEALHLKTQVSEEETCTTLSKASNNELIIPTEPLRRSPTNEGEDSAIPLQTPPDTSSSSLQAEEELCKSEEPSGDVICDDSLKAEEKSVDSGQHSDDDSEGSESEDTLVASTAALRGSRASLDVLDASKDNAQISVNLRLTQATGKQMVKVFHCRRSVHTPSLKPSSKVRSASSGDLLSVCNTGLEAGSDRSAMTNVMKLETEVAAEMEKTGKLLSKVSQSQKEGDEEDMPEDLLAKAMEKLKMADHVLKEVKKLRLAKNVNNRKSW